ncbi:uncharacterized protein LOC119222776 isoform X1 [Pungitius pungitius]|uniref:uncharacterized protein LOC119222776 isoform X1 n=2 Tax=Pungitius pungitius TaxID=134920 RepID=UPI002E0FED80
MLPNLGSKKKERHTEDLPQLTNEMQLIILNKVKSGELSIEDALNQARKDGMQLPKPNTAAEEEPKTLQYNFSVHKHSHYRWQKRVLQIDLNTKMLCSIEKGIIKRQLPFLLVKSCDDGVGSRFTISFKGHHDYELEATSLEDKNTMIQLVNQIIYGNIYSDDAEKLQQPDASQSLQKGVLLLHRGGLASFKWVKYEVQLHPGQLTLDPFKHRGPANGNGTSSGPSSIVIHLSDGDTSVHKPDIADMFTLITHKNEYQFRVPPPDQTSAPGSVQRERDAWVQAIDELCSGWKTKSIDGSSSVKPNPLAHLSIAEDGEDANSELEPCGGLDDTNQPAVENANLPSGDKGQSSDASRAKPIPKPRRQSKTDVIGPDVSPPVPSPTSPDVLASSKPTFPQALTPSSTTSLVKEPSWPSNPPPAPPPCPLKFGMKPRTPLTKAFHWDVVGKEIAKSFWVQECSGRIEIDTSRLYEQFAVKDLGTFCAAEPSNNQPIMLNQKIAHTFNIFLKSFPVRAGELKDKLFIVNEEDGGLSDEHITSLRRYIPMLSDVEMYKSHKGPVAELHIVDQYMMEMCNIPLLSTQLDLLLTLRELPIGMKDLQPLINQKIRMCTQLNNCRSFASVLEYLLAIGNYLNENAMKEKAKGFRLSSLTNLTQLRGTDRKFTLLHALVEQIMLHEPSLTAFTQELAEFETVPGASIKGLTAEVDVLKNELRKVIQYKKTYKKINAGVHHQNFYKDLKASIEKYNTDLSALTKTCEEMKKLYSATLVRFCEPAGRDSQEFFGLICRFVQEFKGAHAEIL